jgi:hypothetical protein
MQLDQFEDYDDVFQTRKRPFAKLATLASMVVLVVLGTTYAANIKSGWQWEC